MGQSEISLVFRLFSGTSGWELSVFMEGQVSSSFHLKLYFVHSKSVVLEHVKNELQKHQGKNQALVKIVRDSLNEYESKLNDLQESLREAKKQTQLAESLNGDNQVLLENLKVIILR